MRSHSPLLAASLSAALVVSCTKDGPAVTPNAVQGEFNATLDGDTREWPTDAAVAADRHFAYFRFTVQGEQFTLQAAPEELVLMLDVDAQTATGRTSELEPLNTMGIDLQVRFSPRTSAGAAGTGVELGTIDAYGNTERLPALAADFMFSPTYASSWYEARLSRTPSATGLLPTQGLLSDGSMQGLWAIMDADGTVSGYSDPFVIRLPTAAPGPKMFTADLPIKPDDALRVMSFNIHNSGPMNNPKTFERLFEAVSADIILLQEWETGDAAAVEAWFTALVASDSGWSVVKAPGDKSNGGAVAVVSKYPAVPVLERLRSGPNGTTGKPVRFAAARIETPIGPVFAASTHLKCCGTKDSREDVQRMDEARAIAQAMKGACATSADAIRIVGGDINLVGSRPPLDLLRAGWDGDGSDLAIADPLVLGDRSMYTWADDNSPFTPGRLDYVAYGDSNARVAHAFVLDTRRLSDESLARLGLDRADSACSDHRPVVVDLVRTK